jgi:DNA polymerase-3 subunit gamma/tau
MLSTQAFNGLLKTLEEPPPHVKFIFATTEIRKVPITILSRCQRFDLRRVDAGTLTANLRNIATLEEIEVDDDALAMIARAAEGSVRDAQSILDQAIAHGAGRVTAEAVRSMLGLADRARIVDLFEHVMKGDAAAALNEFRAQYDTGADPVAVLTDLAEFNHLVTRLRFVPSAADDASLSEEERRRGREFAQALSVRVLSRSWQMLLKGIPEVQASNRPVSAAEMVLIRLAHASDLPTLDEALKSLGDGPSPSITAAPRQSPPSVSPAGPNNGASAVAHGGMPAGNGGGQTMRLVAAEPAPAEMPKSAPVVETAPPPAVPVKSLADLVALADTHRDMAFKVLVKRCVRLVKIEPGRLDVSLTGDAPKTLLGDLTVKLKAWTGRNWLVSLSRQEGGPTLAEQESSKRDTAFQDARSDPAVAAILARFPGAKIIDVRIPDAPDLPDIEADLPPEAAIEDDDEN